MMHKYETIVATPAKGVVNIKSIFHLQLKKSLLVVTHNNKARAIPTYSIDIIPYS
jgi:hypothetical protein